MTKHTIHHRQGGDDEKKKTEEKKDSDPGNYDPGDDVGTRIGEHHGGEGEQR